MLIYMVTDRAVSESDVGGLSIIRESTIEIDNKSSAFYDGESMRMLLDSTNRILDPANIPLGRRKSKIDVKSDSTKNQMIRKHYLEVFKKEVDFHHKVAYRFETCYRLGRKHTDKRSTLNLDIIEIISEHSDYIE